MYTVRQVARALTRSDGAIRQWGKEFADYLSSNANPQKGQAREYTPDDYKVLATISVLSGQGESYEKIHEALERGTRLAPVDAPHEPLETAEKGDISPDVAQAFTTALTAYETRIGQLENRLEAEREKYQQLENELRERHAQELGSERAARLSAEIERAKLEGRLEELLARPPSWWQRLLGG